MAASMRAVQLPMWEWFSNQNPEIRQVYTSAFSNQIWVMVLRWCFNIDLACIMGYFSFNESGPSVESGTNNCVKWARESCHCILLWTEPSKTTNEDCKDCNIVDDESFICMLQLRMAWSERQNVQNRDGSWDTANCDCWLTTGLHECENPDDGYCRCWVCEMGWVYFPGRRMPSYCMGKERHKCELCKWIICRTVHNKCHFRKCISF